MKGYKQVLMSLLFILIISTFIISAQQTSQNNTQTGNEFEKQLIAIELLIDEGRYRQASSRLFGLPEYIDDSEKRSKIEYLWAKLNLLADETEEAVRRVHNSIELDPANIQAKSLQRQIQAKVLTGIFINYQQNSAKLLQELHSTTVANSSIWGGFWRSILTPSILLSTPRIVAEYEDKKIEMTRDQASLLMLIKYVEDYGSLQEIYSELLKLDSGLVVRSTIVTDAIMKRGGVQIGQGYLDPASIPPVYTKQEISIDLEKLNPIFLANIMKITGEENPVRLYTGYLAPLLLIRDNHDIYLLLENAMPPKEWLSGGEIAGKGIMRNIGEIYNIVDSQNPGVIDGWFGVDKWTFLRKDNDLNFKYRRGQNYLNLDSTEITTMEHLVDLGAIALQFGASTAKIGGTVIYASETSIGRLLLLDKYVKLVGIRESSGLAGLMGLDKIRAGISASGVGQKILEMGPLGKFFTTIAGDVGLLGAGFGIDYVSEKTLGFNPRLFEIFAVAYGGRAFLDFSDIVNVRFRNSLIIALENEASATILDPKKLAIFNTEIRKGIHSVSAADELSELIGKATKEAGLDTSSLAAEREVARILKLRSGLVAISAKTSTTSRAIREFEKKLSEAVISDPDISVLKAVDEMQSAVLSPDNSVVYIRMPKEQIEEAVRQGGISREVVSPPGVATSSDVSDRVNYARLVGEEPASSSSQIDQVLESIEKSISEGKASQRIQSVNRGYAVHTLDETITTRERDVYKSAVNKLNKPLTLEEGEFFVYHTTVDSNIPSIAETGLRPSANYRDSQYEYVFQEFLEERIPNIGFRRESSVYAIPSTDDIMLNFPGERRTAILKVKVKTSEVYVQDNSLSMGGSYYHDDARLKEYYSRVIDEAVSGTMTLEKFLLNYEKTNQKSHNLISIWKRKRSADSSLPTIITPEVLIPHSVQIKDIGVERMSTLMESAASNSPRAARGSLVGVTVDPRQTLVVDGRVFTEGLDINEHSITLEEFYMFSYSKTSGVYYPADNMKLPRIQSPVILFDATNGPTGKIPLSRAQVVEVGEDIQEVVNRYGGKNVRSALHEATERKMAEISRELAISPTVFRRMQSVEKELHDEILISGNLRGATQFIDNELNQFPKATIDGIVDDSGKDIVLRGRIGDEEVHIVAQRDPSDYYLMRFGDIPEDFAVQGLRDRTALAERYWIEALDDFEADVVGRQVLSNLGIGPKFRGKVYIEGNPAYALEALHGMEYNRLIAESPELTSQLIEPETHKSIREALTKLWDEGFVVEDAKFTILTQPYATTAKSGKPVVYRQGEALVTGGRVRRTSELPGDSARELIENQLDRLPILGAKALDTAPRLNKLQSDLVFQERVITEVIDQVKRCSTECLSSDDQLSLLIKWNDYLQQNKLAQRGASEAPRLPRYYHATPETNAIKILNTNYLMRPFAAPSLDSPIYFSSMWEKEYGDIVFALDSRIERFTSYKISNRGGGQDRYWVTVNDDIPLMPTKDKTGYLAEVGYKTPEQKQWLIETGIPEEKLVEQNILEVEASFVKKAMDRFDPETMILHIHYIPFIPRVKLYGLDNRIWNALVDGEIAYITKTDKYGFERISPGVVTIEGNKKYINFVDGLRDEIKNTQSSNKYIGATNKQLTLADLEAVRSGEKRLTEVLVSGKFRSLAPIELGSERMGKTLSLAKAFPTPHEVALEQRVMALPFQSGKFLPKENFDVLELRGLANELGMPVQGIAPVRVLDDGSVALLADPIVPNTERIVKFRTDDGTYKLIGADIYHFEQGALKRPDILFRLTGSDALGQKTLFIKELNLNKLVQEYPDFPFSEFFREVDSIYSKVYEDLGINMVDMIATKSTKINIDSAFVAEASNSEVLRGMTRKINNILNNFRLGNWNTNTIHELVAPKALIGDVVKIGNKYVILEGYLDPEFVLETILRKSPRFQKIPVDELRSRVTQYVKIGAADAEITQVLDQYVLGEFGRIEDDIISGIKSGFYEGFVSGREFAINNKFVGAARSNWNHQGLQVVPVYAHPVVRDVEGQVLESQLNLPLEPERFRAQNQYLLLSTKKLPGTNEVSALSEMYVVVSPDKTTYVIQRDMNTIETISIDSVGRVSKENVVGSDILKSDIGLEVNIPRRMFLITPDGPKLDKGLELMGGYLGMVGLVGGVYTLSCGDNEVQAGETCDGPECFLCSYTPSNTENSYVRQLIGEFEGRFITGEYIDNIFNDLISKLSNYHHPDSINKLLEIAENQGSIYSKDVERSAILALMKLGTDDAIELLRKKWKQMSSQLRSSSCISSKPFCEDEYMERLIMNSIEEFFRRKSIPLEEEKTEPRRIESSCSVSGHAESGSPVTGKVVGITGLSVGDTGESTTQSTAKKSFDYSKEFNCLSISGTKERGWWPDGVAKLYYESVTSADNIKLDVPKTGWYGQLIYTESVSPDYINSRCEIEKELQPAGASYSPGFDTIDIYLYKDPAKIKPLIDSKLRTHVTGSQPPAGFERGGNYISGYYVTESGYGTFPQHYYYVSSSGTDVDLIYAQRVGTNCVISGRAPEGDRQPSGPDPKNPFIYPTQEKAEQAKQALISNSLSAVQGYITPELVAFCSLGSDQCEDTDNDVDYYKEGSVENRGRFEYGRDVCASETLLEEFYCGEATGSVGTFAGSIEYTRTVLSNFEDGSGYYDCSNDGMICNNGACICPGEQQPESFTIVFEGGSITVNTKTHEGEEYWGYQINYESGVIGVPNEAGVVIGGGFVYIDPKEAGDKGIPSDGDLDMLKSILEKINNGDVSGALLDFNSYLPNTEQTGFWGRSVEEDLTNIISIILLQKAESGNKNKVYERVINLAISSANNNNFRHEEFYNINIPEIASKYELKVDASSIEEEYLDTESTFVNLQKGMASVLVKTLLKKQDMIGKIQYMSPVLDDFFVDQYDSREFVDTMTVLALLENLEMYGEGIAFLEGSYEASSSESGDAVVIDIGSGGSVGEVVSKMNRIKSFYERAKQSLILSNVGWTSGFGLENELSDSESDAMTVAMSLDGFNLLKIYLENKYTYLTLNDRLELIGLLDSLSGFSKDSGLEGIIIKSLDFAFNNEDDDSIREKIIEALGNYPDKQLAFIIVKSAFENKENIYSVGLEDKALEVLVSMDNPNARQIIESRGWELENKGFDKLPVNLVRRDKPPQIVELQRPSFSIPDSILPIDQLEIFDILLTSGGLSQITGAITGAIEGYKTIIKNSINPNRLDKISAKLVSYDKTIPIIFEETGNNTLEFTYKGEPIQIEGRHGDRLYLQIGDVVEEIEISDPVVLGGFIDPSLIGVITTVQSIGSNLLSSMTENVDIELHKTITTPERKIVVFDSQGKKEEILGSYVSSVRYEICSVGNLVEDFIEMKFYRNDTLVASSVIENIGHRTEKNCPDMGFKTVNAFADKVEIIYSGRSDFYMKNTAKLVFYTHQVESPSLGIDAFNLNIVNGNITSAFFGQSNQSTLKVITTDKTIKSFQNVSPDNVVTVVTNSINNRDIQLIGEEDAVNAVKSIVATAGMKVIGFFWGIINPSAFGISAGESKEVIFRGETVTLKAAEYNNQTMRFVVYHDKAIIVDISGEPVLDASGNELCVSGWGTFPSPTSGIVSCNTIVEPDTENSQLGGFDAGSNISSDLPSGENTLSFSRSESIEFGKFENITKIQFSCLSAEDSPVFVIKLLGSYETFSETINCTETPTKENVINKVASGIDVNIRGRGFVKVFYGETSEIPELPQSTTASDGDFGDQETDETSSSQTQPSKTELIGDIEIGNYYIRLGASRDFYNPNILTLELLDSSKNPISLYNNVWINQWHGISEYKETPGIPRSSGDTTRIVRYWLANVPYAFRITNDQGVFIEIQKIEKGSVFEEQDSCSNGSKLCGYGGDIFECKGNNYIVSEKCLLGCEGSGSAVQCKSQETGKTQQANDIELTIKGINRIEKSFDINLPTTSSGASIHEFTVESTLNSGLIAQSFLQYIIKSSDGKEMIIDFYHDNPQTNEVQIYVRADYAYVSDYYRFQGFVYSPGAKYNLKIIIDGGDGLRLYVNGEQKPMVQRYKTDGKDIEVRPNFFGLKDIKKATFAVYVAEQSAQNAPYSDNDFTTIINSYKVNGNVIK